MSLFKSFPMNTAGRDFAVGDIHGHFTALQALLDKVSFNPAVDRLFSVGDLVDRGPESHLAEEWIKKLYAVQGNHEDMAIRWPDGHMPADNYRANGGGWNMGRTHAQQRATSDALAGLPIAMEVVTQAGLIGLVHADVPGDSWPAFRQKLQHPENVSALQMGAITAVAQWSRDRVDFMDRTVISGVTAVLVGRTPMQAFTSLGNTFYLDTGGWLPHDGRHFTLLNMHTMKVAATYSRNALLDWS